jgi:hypothetical protein
MNVTDQPPVAPPDRFEPVPVDDSPNTMLWAVAAAFAAVVCAIVFWRYREQRKQTAMERLRARVTRMVAMMMVSAVIRERRKARRRQTLTGRVRRF